MKISYNGVPEAGIEVINLEVGAPFAFGGHYYMRVKLDCVDIKVAPPSDKVIVTNLKWGTIRCLKKDEHVKPLRGKISLRDKVIHECCGRED